MKKIKWISEITIQLNEPVSVEEFKETPELLVGSAFIQLCETYLSPSAAHILLQKLHETFHSSHPEFDNQPEPEAKKKSASGVN